MFKSSVLSKPAVNQNCQTNLLKAMKNQGWNTQSILRPNRYVRRDFTIFGILRSSLLGCHRSYRYSHNRYRQFVWKWDSHDIVTITIAYDLTKIKDDHHPYL